MGSENPVASQALPFEKCRIAHLIHHPGQLRKITPSRHLDGLDNPGTADSPDIGRVTDVDEELRIARLHRITCYRYNEL
jgi:hypothetical protein